MSLFASSMLQFGISQMRAIKISNKEWKDKLRQEWRDSMKLPRKKKKQRRKEILLDWSIACWGEEFSLNLDELDMFESVIRRL